MELLVIVILCVLVTAADGSGPTVITVKVDKDVVLPCSLSSKENIDLFEWKKDGEKKVFKYEDGTGYGSTFKDQDKQFRDRVFHFPEELENGIASIKILRTIPSDSGNYTCDFPSLQPRQTFSIKLVVDGAASKPNVKIIEESNSQAVLQCEVNGAFPEPVLQWKDSSGNILPDKKPQVTESEGKYDVILQVTVTKDDNYTCVVTQQDIRHQTADWTVVRISGSSTGVIIALIICGILVVVVVVAVLVYCCYKKGRSTKII